MTITNRVGMSRNLTPAEVDGNFKDLNDRVTALAATGIGGAGPMGPAGPAGTVGSTGLAGAAGTAGLTGPAGTTGTAGAIGPIGPQGIAGTAAAKGDPGVAGPMGPTGATGTIGVTGVAGPTGAAGLLGAPGVPGNPGTTGATGVAGVQGPVGPIGPSGGPVGPAGPTGPTGASGIAAMRVVESDQIALDANKSMPLVPGEFVLVSADRTPVAATGAMFDGVCVVDYKSTGVGNLILSGWHIYGDAWVAEANRVFSVTYYKQATGLFAVVQKGDLNVVRAYPAQVTGLTLGVATSSTQPLSWTAPVANGVAITDYLVEFKPAAGVWQTFAHAVITTTAMTVTSLAASTSHDFRVSAVGADGAGLASAIVTGSTAAAAVVTGRSDTFNRVDSASSNPPSDGNPNWIDYGTAAGFGINGNRLIHQVAGNVEQVLSGCPADGTFLLSIVGDGVSLFPLNGGVFKYAGITFRAVDAANNWKLRAVYGGIIELVSVVAGVQTVEASFQSTLSRTDLLPWELKVVTLGTSIQTFVRQGGAFVAAHSFNSSIHQTATSAGVFAAVTTNAPPDVQITLDDFSAV